MDSLMDIALLAVLAGICALGMFLAILQLPGTWLILVAAVGYDWTMGWSRIGATWLVAAASIALLAEVLEALSGMILAKRGGASRRAMWYGMFGGLAGAFLLTIPIPLFGTIAGAAIGILASERVGFNIEANIA